MTRPDFFIVGAPKCGTTALYHYLRQHPQIFMPDRKEPHFFSVDVRVPGAIRNPVEYAALFEDVGGAARVGEASVSYLASRAAGPGIQRFAPDARIIVMLRDPLQVMVSLHRQLVYECLAEHDDFGVAMRIQREVREPILAHKGLPYVYREAVRFAPQLKRFLELFGEEQVHVILLQDLRDRPLPTFEACLRFLDVDTAFVPEFRVINPGKRARSRVLQQWLKRPPPWLEAAAAALPGRARRVLSESLRRANTEGVAGTDIDAGLLDELARDLAEERDQLESLIGRRLVS